MTKGLLSLYLNCRRFYISCLHRDIFIQSCQAIRCAYCFRVPTSDLSHFLCMCNILNFQVKVGKNSLYKLCSYLGINSCSCSTVVSLGWVNLLFPDGDKDPMYRPQGRPAQIILPVNILVDRAVISNFFCRLNIMISFVSHYYWIHSMRVADTIE